MPTNTKYQVEYQDTIGGDSKIIGHVTSNSFEDARHKGWKLAKTKGLKSGRHVRVVSEENAKIALKYRTRYISPDYKQKLALEDGKVVAVSGYLRGKKDLR